MEKYWKRNVIIRRGRMVAKSQGIVFFQTMEFGTNDFYGQKEEGKENSKSQKKRQKKVNAGFKVL